MKYKKVKGKIIKGKGKGRIFGFATANIQLDRKIDSGAYYGRVTHGQKDFKAAIFIPKSQELLEFHILDFNGDLYGQELEVELLGKLREPIIFKDEAELIRQVMADIEAIRKLKLP